jgi:GNAT superfamily N-acetyltransferase
MAEVSIEHLRAATPDAARQIGLLLPQLTSRADELTLERLARVLAMPGAVYVARAEGRIVGLVQRVDVSHSVRTKCWIEDFVVDEAFRGQGIASRMLELAIREAPKEASSMNLTSGTSRVESHRVYAKLGFKLREETALWSLGL